MNELDGRTIAAVDLGSNSFHLVVAQLRNDARDFVVIDRLKQPVRLRMGLDTTGRLSPEAQARALDCLSLFGERVAGIPRADVRAVGTNTLRSAPFDLIGASYGTSKHPPEPPYDAHACLSCRLGGPF